MSISNQTLKKITKKVGDYFKGEFKSFNVEKSEEEKVELVSQSKPVIPQSSPVLHKANPKPPNTPATNVRIVENSTATQIISHGEPTKTN